MKFALDDIFRVTPEGFHDLALKVFRYQAQNNLLYGQYLEYLKVKPDSIDELEKIPFLPISFFKTHSVYLGDASPQVTFSSSGTTGMEASKHKVRDVLLYERSFLEGFKKFYGKPSNYCILALLPSYLEREGSSLVYMVEQLIAKSGHPLSGFYLHNHEELIGRLLELEEQKQPTILLGVTFALMDLASKFKLKLRYTTIMETGGMKGRGVEPIRSEVHQLLKKSFGTESVHSEYGMTELLSQAYSQGEGVFSTPSWMHILVRDPYDPFSYLPNGRSGALNIIDLANIYSCSFIQTDDLGVKHSNGTFKVLGRMDGSPIRGCNLLVV